VAACELLARDEFDRLINLAGWAVQDRGKASLEIFWLCDDTRANSDNLAPPDVVAQEIVDDLKAALEQFRLIAAELAVPA
jgi:hypothetical protein